MKCVVAIILVVQLSGLTNGDFLNAYRHYFGAGEPARDQQQRDNQYRQPLWAMPNPDATWDRDKMYRDIEPVYKRSGDSGDKGCAPITMWVDKTEEMPVPVVMNSKETRDYKVKQEITQTIINTKSIPYFVTQTEFQPEISQRTAILPQRITQTVRTTNVKFITKTEKTYNTVTAQRTQKLFKTVCPKGH